MALADESTSGAHPAPTSLVRPIELADAVTAAIRELIMSGEVARGDRLVESELSKRFGTSRGPVRDAFKELEQSGLVQSLPRRGTFVATLTAHDIDEIYTLRLALERSALQRTVVHATPEDITAMHSILGEILAAQQAGNRRAGAEADIGFHRMIVQLARHQRLTDAWERVADQTLLLMAELMDLLLDVQHAAGNHRVILKAIERHDIAAAETALEGHLVAARAAMIENAYKTQVEQ